ncbi:WG repeat-containing protein [Chryseobacterium sp.]|uniref:WG repeat-containing protein n=1 Tax=Chryseobacterium sp. TaxID=1871047 RepID=UPI0025BB61C8|nr:WG repeat-containing protein [Chryseobacterium sp.]MBV8325501.1 WG repeat-containing protein [Chryseobacterium sp.]
MKRLILLITTGVFCTIINAQEKTVSLENQTVETLIKSGNYSHVRDFSDGLVVVETKGEKPKYGALDHSGKQVIPFKYDDISDFFEGIARVELHQKFGAINKKGKVIVPIMYDSMSDFQENMAIISLNNKFGATDRNGKIIIPLKYDTLGPFENGTAKALINGKWIFIDPQGKIAE